ncbi:MAG: tetratricopeptide repeat protein, partial [Promethearchaeota archaeon]
MDPTDASLREVDRHLETNPDDASAWNAKGVFHAQKREFGEALRSFDRALQLDPNLGPAYTNRGRVLLALGPEKANGALRAFNRALKLTPNDVQIIYDKASALHALGRTEEELECVRKISELAPNEWGVWVRVGDIELELGLFEPAIKSFDTALGLKDDLAPAYIRRAIAFGMLKRWKEAIKSAETATKLDPDNAEAWLIRGDV